MIETKSSKQTYLGGNQYKLECFGNPVQMREDGGEWFDIDPTFSPDGKVTKAPYELAVDLANKAITMKDKATGAVVSVKLDSILDKLPPNAKIPFRDAEPLISGNKVIWEEIVNGIDVSIVAHNTGVSFRRVIKNKATSHKAQFAIDGKGIPIHYLAYNRIGETIPLVISKEGNLVTEDCEASEDQYPIEIDPTLTVQPSAKDTVLDEGDPTGNYGTDTGSAVYDYSNNTRRLIYEFDISELPANIKLETATLELNFYYGDGDHIGKTVWAYKLTRTDWVEAEATWNIYKASNNWTAGGGDYVTSSPSGGSTTVPADVGWMSWNVLAIIQDAYDGSNAAEFLVKYATEGLGSGYGRTYFRMKEHGGEAFRPKLTITYRIYPQVVSII